MHFKLIAPIVLLGFGALYQNFIVGTVEEAYGVEPGSNQISLTDVLSADNGVIDLNPQRPVVVEDPEDLRKRDSYGWKSYKPGMAGEGDTIHIMDHVIAGHPGRQRKPQRPADYRMLRRADTCTPRPPLATERVVNANIGRTLNPTGLHAFSEADMAEDTQKWLASYYKRPNSVNEKGIVRDHDVPVADIAITDTSAPIYLILQNRQGSVLWNIHTAPGVSIAHIVIIGPETVALNPPAGDNGIDMLRAGTGCIPPVAREPQSWWNIFTQLDRKRKEVYRDSERASIDRQSEALFDRYEAYDAWFRSAFGMGVEDNVVGFDLTDYLLAGPVPATPQQRIPYRPIQGSTVLESQEDYVFTAPKKARVAFMMDLQRDFIATAAGGSLDLLHPDPLQRAVQ